jgi:hypothetical protein
MIIWAGVVYRVACLPSIPMASVVFSVLSIIKSMFDLNVYPLLTTQVPVPTLEVTYFDKF